MFNPAAFRRIALIAFAIASMAWPAAARRLPVLQRRQANAVAAMRRGPIALLAEATRQSGSCGRETPDVSHSYGAQGKIAIEGSGDVAHRRRRADSRGIAALLTAAGAADAPLDHLQWTAVPLDESGFAYVAQAPNLRVAAAKRLAYFTRFLEHANSTIADDAFLEFAHASFDETQQAAGGLSMPDLRAAGRSASAAGAKRVLRAGPGIGQTADDRRQNESLLRRQIEAPAGDFRSGFDGI